MRKTSRRDLAYVMAKKLLGATTVSATMLLAARAGIHVFVTGGDQLHVLSRDLSTLHVPNADLPAVLWYDHML